MQQIETITEIHKWPKCREQLTMGCPTSAGPSTMKHLHPKAHVIQWQRAWEDF